MAVVHITVALEQQIGDEIVRVERERSLARDPTPTYWAESSAYLKALRWVLTTAGAAPLRSPTREGEPS